MIINNWYAAAWSDRLGDEPVAVRMLGCDFALFRDEAGQAHCLSAVCCHRGGDLGSGRRKGSCVQCPYHGWEFAGDGRVTRIPSLGDAARIPGRARVDSYPVHEQLGLIWVFLGDLPEAERPALPDLLPEFGDESNWRRVRFEREWAVNWARLKENLADASHLFLVHSFGKHLPEQTEVFPIEQTDWGVRIPQTYGTTPDAADTVAGRQADGTARTTSELVISLSVIGMLQRNEQRMASGYDQVIWNALTPIDAGHTRHFVIHHRNFNREASNDQWMLDTLNTGFEEDAAVIDRLRPPWTPARQSDELFVATDGPEKAYRDKVTELAATLGMIDARALEDLSRDEVRVIPSPARRAGGQWLHRTVPLLG